jgi:hypothetical protein
MTRAEQRKEIAKVARFVRAAEREINALEIIPHEPYKFPFDIVGLATLSKAFALANACPKLLRSSQSDKTYALSRSIVECAANLRYLTEKRDTQDARVRKFVNHHKADKSIGRTTALKVMLDDRKSKRCGITCNRKESCRTQNPQVGTGRVKEVLYGTQ